MFVFFGKYFSTNPMSFNITRGDFFPPKFVNRSNFGRKNLPFGEIERYLGYFKKKKILTVFACFITASAPLNLNHINTSENVMEI